MRLLIVYASLLLVLILSFGGCTSEFDIGEGMSEDSETEVSCELAVLNFKYLRESEYDSVATKKSRHAYENASFLFLEDVGTRRTLDFLANEGKFVYEEDFDFEKNIMFISYGRMISEIGCIQDDDIRKSYGFNWYGLYVVFREEYFQDKAFFYQMQKEDDRVYVPTCYYLISFVMNGEDRVRIYIGDINNPPETRVPGIG